MRTKHESQNQPAPRDRGATAVEYSILIAMIAAIIVLTVEAVGLDVVGFFGSADW